MCVGVRVRVRVFACLFRIIAEKPKEILYTRPKKYFRCWSQDATEMGYVNINKLAEDMCRYDLDDTDLHWLHTLNTELLHMGRRRRSRV